MLIRSSKNFKIYEILKNWKLYEVSLMLTNIFIATSDIVLLCHIWLSCHAWHVQIVLQGIENLYAKLSKSLCCPAKFAVDEFLKNGSDLQIKMGGVNRHKYTAKT